MQAENGAQSSLSSGAKPENRPPTGLFLVPTVALQNLTEDVLLRALPRTDMYGPPAPLLGKIPLLARLGRGAMGAVYYGIHPRLRIEVAVKVLQSLLAADDPSLVERFYREAQTAARVSSPHLVHVSDVDEEYGLSYIVMEYVRGVSAGDYIKKASAAGRAGVPEEEALRTVIAASKGLAAAHAEGIVHRDVKPSNIMLPQQKDGPGYVFEMAKLADLGLARPLYQASGLTVSFEALGTPGYMAPEQAQDAANVGKPADVFGMAATLYALLCGHAPFTGGTAMAVLSNTIREPHRPITEFSPNVSLATAALLDRCLAKDPQRRCADGAAFVTALRACRDELGVAEGSPAAPKPASWDTTVLSRESARSKGPERVQGRTTRTLPPAAARAAAATIKHSPAPPLFESTRGQKQAGTPGPQAAPSPAAPRVLEARQAPPSARPPAAQQGAALFPPLPSNALGKHQRYVHWPFDMYEARRRQVETSDGTGLPLRMNVPLSLCHERDAHGATGVPPAAAPAVEVGIEMVLLPAGEFLMGSPHGEEFREKDEYHHYVRLTRPFYIGVTPVTQAQWLAVTGENASRFKSAPDGQQRPVERVSWNDIQQKFLPLLAPLVSSGWEFRLPTEAEWEYSCRGGVETPFHFGQSVSIDKLNCMAESTSGDDWKWIYRDNMAGGLKEKQETTPVGAYGPNAWGLYDMHGNVWQWCADWYNDVFCQKAQAVDPLCTEPGEGRVLRGGSWNYTARYCRAACRYHSASDLRSSSVGFRLACALTGSAPTDESNT